MYLDKELLLCDAQAFDPDAASSNTIDLGNVTPKIDLGTGEPMVLCIQVDVAADHTTGNETFNFQLIQSANADLSSPDNLISRTIDYSLLTAGSKHYIPIPPGAITKRYIGLYFDGGGTTPTITLTAWISAQSMIDKQPTYAKGYTIS